MQNNRLFALFDFPDFIALNIISNVFLISGYDFVKNIVFDKAKEQVMKQTNGLYPAPLRILEVVRAGLDKGPTEGYKAEHIGFGELAATSESKALIGLFHGQTECKKNKFGKPAQPSK